MTIRTILSRGGIYFGKAQRLLSFHFYRVLARFAWPVLGKRGPLLGIQKSTRAYATEARLPCHHLIDESFVAVIPAGRVLSDNAIAISPTHRLLDDLNVLFSSKPRSNPIFHRAILPPIRQIEGRLAVLSMVHYKVYFHWMLDILPRLDRIRESKLNVDFFIINNELPFQKETLSILGLNESNIISPQITDHLEAEYLVLPSLSDPPGSPTARACRFLRANFLPRGPGKAPYRRLYISRSDARERRVLNEPEVIDLLEERGFEPITLSGRSVLDQAKLFSETAIVVGPHGAGMTNTVFCPPGATLVEFAPEGRVTNHCFEDLATLVGLEFHRLRSRSLSGPTHDMVVDVAQLKSLLGRIPAVLSKAS